MSTLHHLQTPRFDDPYAYIERVLAMIEATKPKGACKDEFERGWATCAQMVLAALDPAIPLKKPPV